MRLDGMAVALALFAATCCLVAPAAALQAPRNIIVKLAPSAKAVAGLGEPVAHNLRRVVVDSGAAAHDPLGRLQALEGEYVVACVNGV